MIKRILFVEDETHIAELYAMLLRKKGYEVATVADGAEGFKEAQTGNYDLVLLDLMLPNMSGIDILHDLNDPSKSHGTPPPIVILTNLGEDSETVHDILKYAQGYLLKVDVTPKQLSEYIERMQESAGGGDAPAVK
jgi:DNA-binding response OmpR family regulator